MKKTLIAFFSASGVTKAVAHKMAQATGADLFEIIPKVIYTDDDLDWRNGNSRSSLEMKDRSSRPPISKMPDVSAYDVILLGFPVWWYREPSVIDTFTEGADLHGKTVVPFCTSGGSGLGDAARNIQELAPGAAVRDGRRFSASTPADELKAWAEQF